MAPSAIDEWHVKVLSDAALELGLEVPDPKGLTHGVVEGVARTGRHVALGFRSVANRPVGYAVHASSPTPHLGRVSIRTSVLWRGGSRMTRVRTGDLRFDGILACHGHALSVHSMLGHEARETVTTMFAEHSIESIEVDEERVTIRGDGFDADGENLARLAEAAGRLSALFVRRPSDPNDRLLSNVLEDAAPRARAICAEVLLGRIDAGSIEERRVCSAMAGCDSLLARLRVDVMIRLRRHDPSSVRHVFEEALDAEAPEVLENALRYVGELQERSLRGRLVDLMRHEHDSVCAAAAWSLGRLGGPDAEEALAAQLDPSRSESVHMAVVEALGLMGGVRSLGALRPRKRGLFRSRAMKRAARLAIERIESRVEPGESGTLAVVQPSGELSLRSDDPGE